MIDINRLRAIEAAAQSARALAVERFHELGFPYERIWDVPLATMLLTSGVVASTANLVRSGERLAGVMEGNPAAPIILYEEYDPFVRQRFSVAHELGHFYLHRPPMASPTSSALLEYHRCVQERIDPESTSDDEDRLRNVAHDIEAEADAFAGAFLLSVDEVLEDLAHFGTSVAFLAERYGVSEAAVRRRLKTLKTLGEARA